MIFFISAVVSNYHKMLKNRRVYPRISVNFGLIKKFRKELGRALQAEDFVRLLVEYFLVGTKLLIRDRLDKCFWSGSDQCTCFNFRKKRVLNGCECDGRRP
jgi:hypothetical protein